MSKTADVKIILEKIQKKLQSAAFTELAIVDKMNEANENAAMKQDNNTDFYDFITKLEKDPTVTIQTIAKKLRVAYLYINLDEPLPVLPLGESRQLSAGAGGGPKVEPGGAGGNQTTVGKGDRGGNQTIVASNVGNEEARVAAEAAARVAARGEPNVEPGGGGPKERVEPGGGGNQKIVASNVGNEEAVRVAAEAEAAARVAEAAEAAEAAARVAAAEEARLSEAAEAAARVAAAEEEARVAAPAAGGEGGGGPETARLAEEAALPPAGAGGGGGSEERVEPAAEEARVAAPAAGGEGGGGLETARLEEAAARVAAAEAALPPAGAGGGGGTEEKISSTPAVPQGTIKLLPKANGQVNIPEVKGNGQPVSLNDVSVSVESRQGSGAREVEPGEIDNVYNKTSFSKDNPLIEGVSSGSEESKSPEVERRNINPLFRPKTAGQLSKPGTSIRRRVNPNNLTQKNKPNSNQRAVTL